MLANLRCHYYVARCNEVPREIIDSPQERVEEADGEAYDKIRKLNCGKEREVLQHSSQHC